MGQCGCSDFNASHKFAGPEGITYAFEVNVGCAYCGTPAGVVVYRFDAEHAEQWDIASLPDLPFISHSARVTGKEPDPPDPNGEFAQGVFDPEVAVGLLTERLGATFKETDDDGDVWTLAERLEDEGREIVDDAIAETLRRLDAARATAPTPESPHRPSCTRSAGVRGWRCN